MARLFSELLRDLKSEEWENLTCPERHLIVSGLKKAEKRRAIGALMAGFLTFAATKALYTTTVTSLNLAGGAAYLFGKWMHNRSLGSSLDNIIALQGSLLQEKLANIIIRKYPEDTRRMQVLCKFFILERIDIDSRYYQRWRSRNCFGDTCILGQAYKRRMTTPKQASGTIKLGFKDIVEDPLEYLFGETISWKEIHHFNAWYASSLGMLEFDDWVDHDFIRLV